MSSPSQSAPPTLDEELIAEFYNIILDRYPIEACGVLLPTPHRGKLIWEMPNRSLKGDKNYRMESADVHLALGDWIVENSSRIHEVTFWHSHPSGNPMPSAVDLRHRVHQACNLVMAIDLDTENIVFNWF